MPKQYINYDQKLLLASRVKDNKELLLGSFKNSKSTFKEKEKMWKTIAAELGEAGFITESWRTVRDYTWGNLMRRTREKYLALQKTGQGKFAVLP